MKNRNNNKQDAIPLLRRRESSSGTVSTREHHDGAAQADLHLNAIDSATTSRLSSEVLTAQPCFC
jgi:hypothetical protein